MFKTGDAQGTDAVKMACPASLKNEAVYITWWCGSREEQRVGCPVVCCLVPGFQDLGALLPLRSSDDGQ
ncbi:hypothetical protein ACOMHN_064744 [Nucella lapillus]